MPVSINVKWYALYHTLAHILQFKLLVLLILRTTTSHPSELFEKLKLKNPEMFVIQVMELYISNLLYWKLFTKELRAVPHINISVSIIHRRLGKYQLSFGDRIWTKGMFMSWEEQLT